MKLSSYIDPKLILLNLDAENKDEAIKQMIKKVAKRDEFFRKRKDDIEEAVLKREHEISTALGRGIGIPHARVEGYDDVVVAIAVAKDPLECEIVTKEKGCVKVFFMIVAGQTKNKLMLKIMSAITKLALQKGMIEEMVNKNTSEAIYELIKKTEIEVEERITAQDIMTTDIKPLNLDDTLQDIARRFAIEHLRGIPVIDTFGKFIGEITEREIIEYGMPKYTSLMSDLSFMTVGEPFEQYFKNEKKITVRELYRKNAPIVDRKASIMEVSFEMVTKGNTRVYVVEDGKFYGMILRGDIIRKVLHI